MKAEWIRGRFRGVYSADRRDDSERARRVPLDLEYGEISEVEMIAGEPAPDGGEEIRFERVRRVKIAASEDGPAPGERTLFDVRIRRGRLLFPAESGARMYGTLEGELSARLFPAAVEPEPLPLAKSAADPAPPISETVPAPSSPDQTARDQATAIEPLPLSFPDLSPRRDDSTPEQDMEHLLWLIVPGLLAVVGVALALGCGPVAAAIWLAPLAAAIAIRQTPARYRIHSTLARRWFGGACVLAPIFAVLTPLHVAWVMECREPIAVDLALVGAPVVAAALIRTQVWVWTCALFWTVALLGWCGNLAGSCTEPAALAAAARREVSAAARVPRVDASGRWPAAPAPAGGETPVREELPISLEQALRDPDAFFERSPAKRVYLPTDELFAASRAEVRREGEDQLAHLASLLALHPDRRVVIEVHTDASGDAAQQRVLSQRRAASVSQWLIQRGRLSRDQLVLAPVGGAQPIVPPDGSDAQQRPNRRLEIRLAGGRAAKP